MTLHDGQHIVANDVGEERKPHLDLHLVNVVAGEVRQALGPALAAEEFDALDVLAQVDRIVDRGPIDADDLDPVVQTAYQLATVQVEQEAIRREASGDDQLNYETRTQVVQRVLFEIFALGGFTPLLADPDIENIFVNGHDEVWISRSGTGGFESAPPVCLDDEVLKDLIADWARRYGQTARQFNTRNPRLDLRLPSGQRLHAIMGVTDRPTITIRCPAKKLIDLDALVRTGAVTSDMAVFLTSAVNARCNIIVAGGTSTGKTTLLRSLLLLASKDERLVVLEDTAELHLRRHLASRNIVEMETRQANSDGVGEIGLLELTRECLRMSPDRVVVGEVRGAEAIYMLKAMGQGNDGSMCTVHAESVPGVLNRMRVYCAEGSAGLPIPVIDGLYGTAVDLVVHLRTLPDRQRVVSAIAEVLDEPGEHRFLFGPSQVGPGQMVDAPGPSTALAERLAQHDGYTWGAS